MSVDSQGYLLVNNDPILWSMLNAIKEQKAPIRQQQAEIGDLTTRLAKLEALTTPKP